MCMVLAYFELKISYIKDTGDSLDSSHLDYLHRPLSHPPYSDMLQISSYPPSIMKDYELHDS